MCEKEHIPYAHPESIISNIVFIKQFNSGVYKYRFYIINIRILL